jgi:AbrB family looped-hinge helix DNA binding protein
VDATLKLGKQGRLVIPAEIRAALGLSPGDRVHIRLDGPRIIMERPADAIDELRALGREKARHRSLVDELLAERRAELRDN